MNASDKTWARALLMRKFISVIASDDDASGGLGEVLETARARARRLLLREVAEESVSARGERFLSAAERLVGAPRLMIGRVLPVPEARLKLEGLRRAARALGLEKQLGDIVTLAQVHRGQLKPLQPASGRPMSPPGKLLEAAIALGVGYEEVLWGSWARRQMLMGLRVDTIKARRACKELVDRSWERATRRAPPPAVGFFRRRV